MSWLGKRIRSTWRNEDGVATIEFVFAVPLLIAIFSASFESGLFMLRSILLEQSLDMTMRELRLGHYVDPADPDAPITDQFMKEEICRRTIILSNCEDSLKINLTKVTMDTFTMPTGAMECVDRTLPIAAVQELDVGQQNDLMLIRACMVQDAMFPFTGVGLGLSRTDAGGGYEIIAASAFAVEPT